jgi:hypothetical protein
MHSELTGKRGVKKGRRVALEVNIVRADIKPALTEINS